MTDSSNISLQSLHQGEDIITLTGRSRLLGNLKVPEHFKCATDLAFLDMTFREDVMARHHYPEFIAGVVR